MKWWSPSLRRAWRWARRHPAAAELAVTAWVLMAMIRGQSASHVVALAAVAIAYGVARAALRPVERYRVAAERAGNAPVLPVDPGKNDEITRLGRTLNALLARISAANERERQFLADTSHELRSPLSLMRTELEMQLLRPRPPEEAKAALESLQDQVERLIAMSNALLDLEEVRAGEVPTGEQADLPVLPLLLRLRNYGLKPPP